jgi:hypothetical protein
MPEVDRDGESLMRSYSYLLRYDKRAASAIEKSHRFRPFHRYSSRLRYTRSWWTTSSPGPPEIENGDLVMPEGPRWVRNVNDVNFPGGDRQVKFATEERHGPPVGSASLAL